MQQHRDIMFILSNTNRLAALQLIIEHGEITVGDLAKRLGISQSALSQHLRLMKKANLVTVRGDAQTRYYSCDNAIVKSALKLLAVPPIPPKIDCGRSINLIAAIGNNLQIGLNDRLAWSDFTARKHGKYFAEAVRNDLRCFAAVTRDSHLIMGSTTCRELTAKINEANRIGRTFWQFSRQFYKSPLDLINQIPDDDRAVWVIGGAQTYRAFAPYINGLKIINRIPYDGPADTYFPEELLS